MSDSDVVFDHNSILIYHTDTLEFYFKIAV